MSFRNERRPRVFQACNWCRVKKNKCDGYIPCSHCKGQGRECVFRGGLSSSLNRSEYSLGYVQELELRLGKMKELEKSLERAEAALRAQVTSQQDNTTPSKVVQERQEAGSQQPKQFHQSQNERAEAGTSSVLVGSLAATAHETHKEMLDNSADEVMDMNNATRRFEFHGKISSLSFLNRLVRMKEGNPDCWRSEDSSGDSSNRQIINEFQNEAFTRQHESPRSAGESAEENYYPLYAFLFIDSYFKTLHFVHPILDQDIFLERCHSLWTGHGIPIHQSFKALYFAVLSLGALTRTWTEGLINGMDRSTWTRVLFDKAELLMHRPGSLNDLEAVQALIIMAQVCEHQLTPNLAYTYLGLAVRTAFSTGINRFAKFRDSKFPQDSPTGVVSRTWWALYSLETESSFNLGRPDILGSDCSHNRPPPLINEGSEITIIPSMLGLSRIMREISRKMYSEPTGLSEKFQRASEYEHDLNNWLVQLPSNIRPHPLPKTLGNHYWPKLQMLVLKLRYLHVRIVLYYVFFLLEQKQSQSEKATGRAANNVYTLAQKCKDAAVEIVETLHTIYCTHHFFQSWWVNTTYIARGLSIILATFAREPAAARQSSADLHYINQAFEILKVMDECVVARNIGTFFRDLVDTLLAAGTNRSDRENGQQTHSVESDLATSSVLGFAGHVNDFTFDFNDFNFLDANFQTLHNEQEPDAGFELFQAIGRG